MRLIYLAKKTRKDPLGYLNTLNSPLSTCAVIEITNMVRLIPVTAASFKKLIMSFEETLLELKNLLKSVCCEGLFMGLKGIPVPILMF